MDPEAKVRPMLLALSVILVAPAAATPRPAGMVEGILAAEWSFIHHCERDGIKAAFVAAFHPEGLLFRPMPCNGREWYGSQPESPARLAWFPAITYTAVSGDLGCNAGPWEWRARAGDPAAAFGWFFSVWKRQPGSGWQLFWDIGIPTRSAARGVAPLTTPSRRPRATVATAPLTEAQALELDRRFAAQAAKGMEPAYRIHFAPEGRLFRSPDQPATGWPDARHLLAASPGHRTWEPRGAAVATSGEILFVQGSYRRDRTDGPAETGTYIRVWRRLGTAWTLELDLESPQPAKPAP